MISQELRDWIMFELPEDGEWWNSGYETFIQYANFLYDEGITEDDIKEIFTDLYSAVAGEFGN